MSGATGTAPTGNGRDPAPSVPRAKRGRKTPSGSPPPATPEVGTLRPPTHGHGLILYGSRAGPNHPAVGHGRPRNAFKAMMAELANLPEAEATLRAILRGEQAIRMPGGVMLVDARTFLECYRFVAERGYGKVAAATEGEARERGPVTVRLIHAWQSA